MVQILARGEVVYACDVCKRRVRIPANRRGLEVMQRCIITKGCSGSLHKELNRREIASTPSLTPAVEGVTDWFQRKIIFNYYQTTKSKEWIVEHNLGAIPAVQVFVYRIDPTTLKPVLSETTAATIASTSSTAIIRFDTAVDGFVQCLSLSSTAVPTENVVTSQYFQITNQGELTIATLDPTPSVSVTARYTNTFTNEYTDIVYTNVDNTPSVLSPWVGSSAILMNGKRYYIRSFNIVTTPRGDAFFSSLDGSGSNGYSISFPTLENVLGSSLILLGRSPYSAVDRIVDRYIDIGTMKNYPQAAILVNGNINIDVSTIRTVYPLIVPL